MRYCTSAGNRKLKGAMKKRIPCSRRKGWGEGGGCDIKRVRAPTNKVEYLYGSAGLATQGPLRRLPEASDVFAALAPCFETSCLDLSGDPW